MSAWDTARLSVFFATAGGGVQASHLVGGQLAPLKLKRQLADRLGTGLPARLAEPIEVWVCKGLLTGGALHRVKSQHTLQQAQGAPVCLHKVLLEVHPRLLAHVHQEPARLLIAHLNTRKQAWA